MYRNRDNKVESERNAAHSLVTVVASILPSIYVLDTSRREIDCKNPHLRFTDSDVSLAKRNRVEGSIL